MVHPKSVVGLGGLMIAVLSVVPALGQAIQSRGDFEGVQGKTTPPRITGLASGIDGITDAGMLAFARGATGPLFPGQLFAAGGFPASVSLGDLDGDGDLDMAVVNDNSDDTSVLLNNGDGIFADQMRFATGSFPASVAFGDLNGDGDLDMVVANEFSHDTSVLLNNGDGTFADQTRFAAGFEPKSVALGDLDADGDMDMAVANDFSNDTSVLLNQSGVTCPADIDGDGDADVADFFAFVVAFGAGDPAADVNGDGSIDLGDFLAFVAAFAAGCP